MRIARTLPEPVTTSSRGTALAPVAIAGLTAIALLNACSSGSNGIGGGGDTPQVFETFFAPVSPLEERHVDVVVRATIDSIDFSVFAADADPRAYVVVMDRLGNYMGLYAHGVSGRTGLSNPNLQDPAVFLPTDDDRVGVNAAAAVARAAAYLSHSEAPLTSRTGEFLATFHSPALFEADPARFLQVAPNVYPGVSLPVRPTNGITNTGLADLWQIDASNRGSFFAGVHGTDPAAFVEVCGTLAPIPNSAVELLHFQRFDRFREIIHGNPELAACRDELKETGFGVDLGALRPHRAKGASGAGRRSGASGPEAWAAERTLLQTIAAAPSRRRHRASSRAGGFSAEQSRFCADNSRPAPRCCCRRRRGSTRAG